MQKQRSTPNLLRKAATGIDGLDKITHGGLPHGRPTLVCSTAGCGKTLLALEFLVRGARDFGEPGVFMAFEETAEDLAANAASIGFDLDAMVARGQLLIDIDHVPVDRTDVEEAGEYNLDGLFIRLAVRNSFTKRRAWRSRLAIASLPSRRTNCAARSTFSRCRPRPSIAPYAGKAPSRSNRRKRWWKRSESRAGDWRT